MSGNPVTQKRLLLNFRVFSRLIESSFWHPTSRAAVWTRSPPTPVRSLTGVFPIEDNIRWSGDGKLSINNEWRVTPCLFYKPPSPGAPPLTCIKLTAALNPNLLFPSLDEQVQWCRWISPSLSLWGCDFLQGSREPFVSSLPQMPARWPHSPSPLPP